MAFEIGLKRLVGVCPWAVDESQGGSAESWLCALPARANVTCHVEMGPES